MEYIIAAFRSRNVTTRVYNYLIREFNINCAIVSTPRACGVGCGLSIKMNRSDLQRVLQLSTVETFAGFFVINNIGGTTTVSPI